MLRSACPLPHHPFFQPWACRSLQTPAKMLQKVFVVALAAFTTFVSSGPVPRQAAVTGKSPSSAPPFHSTFSKGRH